MGKVERNAACPCGTEKQYKSRCLQEYEASARAERKAGNSTLAADTDRGRAGSNVSAGSDAGGDRAAGPYALVETSKLKASCPACGQAIHPLFRKWDCRYGERPIIEIISNHIDLSTLLLEGNIQFRISKLQHPRVTWHGRCFVLVMDHPRTDQTRRLRRRWMLASAIALSIVSVTVAVIRLKPAAPTVERSLMWIDTVKRGEML